MVHFQMRSLLFLVPLVCLSTAFKMVLIAPATANSQVMFNKRVAETLSAAGHDVSLALIQEVEGTDVSDVKISDKIKVYIVNATVGITKKQMEEGHADFTFKDVSLFDSGMRELMAKRMQMMQDSCRNTLRNKKFMKWLEESKFDLAFVHMYQACPIGLVHAAKIPAWIWLNSASLVDFVADTVGVPTYPSWVPPLMMAAHDSMTFYERIKSFIGHVLMKIIWPRKVAQPETDIFREEVDPEFPSLLDLAANCSLVMVNSNPLYDLPRPTLAKVINIGGIGAQLKDAKPLSKELEEIVNRGEATVVMSFGSIAPIHKMPSEWKTALLAAFARLSHLQFVVRYMDSDLNDRLPPNVHLMKWLPQSDLLQHKRVKAFVSHGGYNSMQETIAAGKPILMIPLFGDQPKNARIAEKHGIARVLLKSDFSEQNLFEHISTVTSDPSYAASAQRLSAMVARQPVPAEQQLVRWAELLAEFKHLDNLTPAGQKLNFFQYHSLDVIFFLLAVLAVVLFLIFALLRCIVRKLYRCVVPKKQKND